LHLAVEVLERRSDEASPISKQKVRSIRRATTRLAKMVEGLLDFVQSERGLLDVTPRDASVTAVARTVAADLHELVVAKGLRLDVRSEGGDEVRAFTDPELLRVILTNLVENATKYTDDGSVSVRLAAADGSLRLEVADTGCGIPPDRFSAIFEPFTHLEPLGKKHVPGVGLGLALVRALVDTLGGSIEVRSKVDVGSTFTVTLPRFQSGRIL
jgi:signal transduction histidine kinase